MPVLTPADHEHFLEHGYLVLRGLVPQATVDAAVEVLEAAPDDRGRGAPEVAACCTDDVLDAIAELFAGGTSEPDERPRYTLARYRSGGDMPRPHKPGADWPTPIAHVDDSYPTVMPNGWAVGSFIFLTRVLSHGGAFILFPGSYRRYRQLLDGSCHCIKGAARLPEHSGPPQEFLAEPGDVLLFHHLMGHTGSDNVADPVTRHALLSRWHPEQVRIVPGDRPFDEMTTIEKANSARYLAHRFGDASSAPTVPSPASVLAEGFAPGESFQRTAILHFGGRLHLLAVTAGAPDTVRHWHSDTGVDWHETEPLTVPGRITELQLHQYGVEAILAVTTADGMTQLSSTLDMVHFTPESTLHGDRAVTPWFVYANYPSKTAAGQALFRVPADAPHRVDCSWGAEWNGAADWTTRATSLEAPAGGHIESLTIAAHVADSKCTFVVDVNGPNGAGRQPWFAQPADIAVADTALRPLPHDAPSAPRGLRIVSRARLYWLVTYLRDEGGSDRLFWGSIDWNEDNPTLSEIRTAADLTAARHIVGFA